MVKSIILFKPQMQLMLVFIQICRPNSNFKSPGHLNQHLQICIISAKSFFIDLRRYFAPVTNIFKKIIITWQSQISAFQNIPHQHRNVRLKWIQFGEHLWKALSGLSTNRRPELIVCLCLCGVTEWQRAIGLKPATHCTRCKAGYLKEWATEQW